MPKKPKRPLYEEPWEPIYAPYIPVCTCESCQFFDPDRLRCLAPDNPKPKQPTYPSDTCKGWRPK
jgi:hypothetical protein